MNNYCKICRHRDIPKILKEKYNEYVNLMFIECPMEDERIVGCLNSNFAIKWQEFYEWVYDKGLTKSEKKLLEGEGWKIPS